MKKIIISTALLITLSVSMTNCKKTEDTPVADDQSLLMNTNWKMTAGTVSPPFNGATDFYAGLQACDKDNLYKFNANNVFVKDEGATKCDASDPQAITGTWSYDNATKRLKFKASNEFEMTVTELNSTTLKGTGQEVINGTTYTENLTFTAQ